MTWKTRGQQAADTEMSPETLNGKSTYRVGHFKDIPHPWNSGRHTKANYRVSEDPKQVHGVSEANTYVKSIPAHFNILIFLSTTIDVFQKSNGNKRFGSSDLEPILEKLFQIEQKIQKLLILPTFFLYMKNKQIAWTLIRFLTENKSHHLQKPDIFQSTFQMAH